MKTTSRGLRPGRGMTLVELLIAFLVLLMLVSALVALTTQSLETWSKGEARKESYDRAQTVLDLISSDLRNAYSENEIVDDGRKALMPPVLACDPDKNRNPRLRFVRAGKPAVMRTAPPQPQRLVPQTYYGAQFEVAYVIDPDPAKATLWRGVRAYDRRNSGTLLRPAEYSSAGDAMFTSHFTPVETGILYVGYKFWTQFSSTWDDAVAIQRGKPGSTTKSGPEKWWDSTRRDDRGFYFHRPQPDVTNPDFVYPEIVEVTVTVESPPSERSGVRLNEGCDERTASLRLTHTRGMPDGPAMAKIGSEWIEYGERGFSDLMTVRRGQRGTSPQSHAPGTPVRFGETFTTEVRIPAFREAQEP